MHPSPGLCLRFNPTTFRGEKIVDPKKNPGTFLQTIKLLFEAEKEKYQEMMEIIFNTSLQHSQLTQALLEKEQNAGKIADDLIAEKAINQKNYQAEIDATRPLVARNRKLHLVFEALIDCLACWMKRNILRSTNPFTLFAPLKTDSLWKMENILEGIVSLEVTF